MSAGAIRRRGQTWTWLYEGTDPATGKRRQYSKGGFRTKKAAQAALDEARGSLTSGDHKAPARLPLGTYLTEHWLPGLALRNTTMANYDIVVRKWIIPAIGGLPLASVTPAHVSGLLADLGASGGRRGEGLSPRSVQLAYVILKKALGDAMADGMLARNPCARVARPAGKSAQMDAWSAEELGVFLASIEDDRLYAAFALTAARGLRRGEVCGSLWSDLNLDSGRMSITRTRVLADGKVVESTPKTAAGRRNVPLSPKLVAILRSHRRGQLEERVAAEAAWSDTGHVFTDELGRPLHPEYLSTAFEVRTKRAGVRVIRFHDLRHTCATLALGAGIPTEAVSRWLGHANVSITQDIYQHEIPALMERSGELLDEVVFGGAS